MMTTILLALFIAIAERFMSDEVISWSSWLHSKLRRIAVAKLPAECRERYYEEWESGLLEVPGEIFKMFYSMNLIWAAVGIRRSALKSAADSKRAFALLKRLIDIGISSFALVAWVPVLVAIAIAIKLSSDGPVFYGSKRIGKNGRLFHCFKFRTMALGKHTSIACTTDPRITGIGSILRKYSLDELPQFFNVLCGDISIVGPRAPIPNEVREYELGILPDVTPGITGLWQIEAYQQPSIESYLRLNEYYAKNRGLWLDLKIILRTIYFVFVKTGPDTDRDMPGKESEAE